MKKYILIVCCLLASTSRVLAQGQLGVKISPGLTYNTICTNPDTTHFSSAGFHTGMWIGLNYDYSIKDNYYLNSGLFFAVRKFSIENPSINNTKIKEVHTLQYLQIPLLFKLYTGEIALDTRIYVELGPVGSIKLNHRVSKLTTDKVFIKQFKAWEIVGLLGVGVEYNISLFTSIFAGISYQHGLSSVLAKQDEAVQVPLVDGYNHYINLELGIKL